MRATRVVAMAVALAALGPFGVASGHSDEPTPPTLSGESFHQDTPTITAMNCRGIDPLTFGYSATGTASGPYPGTFTVSGTVTAFQTASSSFTIDSPVGRVTGTFYISGPGMSCAGACLGVLNCADHGGQFGCCGPPYREGGPYEASITTPTGTFTDHGFFSAEFYRSGDNPLNRFDQSFESSVSAPEPVPPTTKEQCKHGGWRDFGFESKRKCIRVVKRQARQSCRAERATSGRGAFREKYGRHKHHGRALHNCIKQTVSAS
jgi:hypothetical protein